MTGARSARVMLLHPDDDVVLALVDLSPGDDLDLRPADSGTGRRRAVTAVTAVIAVTAVPRGHKVALRSLAVGASVHKYGEVIGRASAPIASGEHVHTHNLAFTPTTADRGISRFVDLPAVTAARTFDGFRRPDGLVGTRNYIGVLSSVNCSVTVGKLIAQAAGEKLRDFPNVDGVVALGHAGGCGLANGQGLQILQRTLRGYAAHPNFAGILMVGLGCEVNQVADLDLGFAPATRTLTIQESGGTTNAIRAGLAAIDELLAEADAGRRTPVPLAELMLGLNCGGSDAYSGITANPALGVAADMLVSHGGTAVLGETPEIYGAAHLLTSRAVDSAIADRLLERLAWWE
ncbi:MAG TPA: UxaA family hydrolase, partial [Acidothermaceae bacterium]